MPDDKYNDLYIHKELVKGKWYGICSGPKPQVYTGNIDTDSNLEDIRNKALYIVSPSSANGTFPVYGHKSAVLTTRYGNNVYLQRLFDIDAGVEWERAKIGSTSWYEWKRVTTEGDASSLAQSADTRSRDNATAINQINNAIGGRTASPNIDSRVRSNTSAIGSLSNDYNAFKNGTNLSIMSLRSNVVTALDHSNKIVNNDVRAGQLPGIKFYANTNVFTVINQSSVQVIAQDVCNNWGANFQNSMFFVSNGDAADHPVHVEGGSYLNGNGWWAVFDRDFSGAVRINWMLAVFSQSIA